MDIRVFEKPPISGSLPEHHFDAQGDCTWIEFMLDDGATWAGVFGDGKIMKHQRAAVPFADGRTAFVIANGRGYVLDVPRHDLLYRTKIDYWATALSVPGRDFVIAAEFTRIAAIGRLRELWQSETIALDGIILDSSTFEELSGKVWWEDGWYAFTLRYNGFVYQRGLRLATDWRAFTPPSG